MRADVLHARSPSKNDTKKLLEQLRTFGMPTEKTHFLKTSNREKGILTAFAVERPD